MILKMIMIMMIRSVGFQFKSGGWVQPSGEWGLLWTKPGRVALATDKCEMVEFKTTAGDIVKAWKC